MSVFFWLATIVMSVLAFAFVANPLRKADRQYLVIAVGVFVPLAATSMYLLFGSPNVASASSSATMTASMLPKSSATAGSDRKKVGSVSSMLEGLEQRLQENPDDGKGWLLLAKSYKHLNRPDDAAAAYRNAIALGEYDESLEGLTGAAASQADATASGAGIYGNVSLSSRAAQLVEPTDTVFIFARAAQGAGVPAAVLQRPAAELPIDFLLNDSQSMMPSIKLSDFDEVIVTARISRSGNASEALQGLEAKSETLRVADNQHVTLVID